MSDKPEECYSCGFETSKLKDYRMNRYMSQPDAEQMKWLCELCASTMAGNAYEYPEQFPDIMTLKTICYVGNVILAKLSHTTNEGRGE